MDNQNFINALKLVRPAIIDIDYLPSLRSFSFDGKTVTGYNDSIGIEVTCDVPLDAVIDGFRLSDLVNSGLFGKLKFDQKDEQVTIKCGKTRLDLPIFPREEYIFDMPSTPLLAEECHEIDPVFTHALEVCLLSVDDKLNHPEMRGVTVSIAKGEGLAFYSTDIKSISMCVVDTDDPNITIDGVLFPTAFCKTLLNLIEQLKDVDPQPLLYIRDDHFLCVWDDKNSKTVCKLFGRRVQVDEPLDFEQEIANCLDTYNIDKLTPVSETLTIALDRALILGGKDCWTQIDISKGKATLETGTMHGNVEDELKFEHTNISTTVFPSTIRKAFAYGNKITFSQNWTFVGDGENFLYISANKI